MNHNYNTPSEGATNWHVPLNENFNQLDVDVEIRAPEANKPDHDPAVGAKYEATDSGAVYYGNGDTWILSDRKVNSLESDSFSTGEHLKSGDSSMAIVAPSVGSAYNTIKSAIADGHNDIKLAEEITEANIDIPNGELFNRRPFRLEGVGNGIYQKINQPGGEPYCISTQPSEGDNLNIQIRNIHIDGRDATGEPGIAIKGAGELEKTSWSRSQNGIGRSVIENCRVTGGPVYLFGPRVILYHCDFNCFSNRLFPVPGVDRGDGNILRDKAALHTRGATFGIYGGSFTAKQDAKTSAYIANGAFTISGGTTFANPRKQFSGDDLTSAVVFKSASRGFISGISTELVGSVDYDVQFGMEELVGTGRAGCAQVTFANNSMFESLNIEGHSHNTKIRASGDITIRKKQRAKIVIESTGNVKFEDGINHHEPQQITHINPADDGAYRIGGNRNSPPTSLGLQIHTSPSPDPQEATLAVADGTNWDPIGNGNAAIVAYDTDGDWKPVFEYSGSM